MYFYLEWLDKRPTLIQLSHDKPETITFQESFRIKNKEYILCGNINPNFKTYYPPPKLEYTKNQYLLSHIQKSVRRMDDIKSVQSAKHLIDLDCTSFLRRLPIIMLEDVTLHESITIIVWLMIANSKKFPLKLEMIKWLLGIVYYLSNETEKTFYSKEEKKYEWDDNSLTEQKKLLLYTLRFRKAYGGMGGDMKMIEYYIGLVLKDKVCIKKTKIPLVKPFMEPLLKKDWIYEANDFHCNRFMIDRIHQYYPKYKKDYLKQLVWNFSSSLNQRESVQNDKDQEEDWDRIKKRVRKIQKRCIYY